MLKQKFIVNKGNPLTKCDNCGRLLADHQVWMHGKGRCSEEPTKFELKVRKLQALIREIQQESAARSALPPELQKRYEEICIQEELETAT